MAYRMGYESTGSINWGEKTALKAKCYLDPTKLSVSLQDQRLSSPVFEVAIVPTCLSTACLKMEACYLD
uniref:Uncharacterized protein n=1 Tax=Ditylenchus dipsaci TaxID=166011 RepID=A0A915E607_9BILA